MVGGEKKKSVRDVFLKKPVPFSKKRDLNWSAIRNVSIIGALLIVLGILFMPAPKVEVTYREGEQHTSELELPRYNEQAGVPASVPGYRTAMGYPSGSGASTSGRTRNGSMVIAREGLDPNSQLHPGSRIKVRLLERVVVSAQSLPVIGVVTEDCSQDGTVAIPKGSKVFGEIGFDSDSKRGVLTWRSIQLQGGRVTQFEAVSTSLDGQAGVEGQVHSDAVKNTVGQAMTRFIGAYAEGSMQKTSFMGSPGGKENGMKNAVAETAKDQADRMADRMKKEREWLELSPGVEFFALLTQAFRFRDPGGVY